MTSSLERKLLLAREMPQHLSALTQYAGRPITRADLLSVEETSRIREQLRSRPEGPRAKRRFSFEDRAGPVFVRLLNALHAASPGAVQVWIKTTSDCGLLVLHSLKDFNLEFAFEADPNGVVTLRTSDLENELLLDYYEEDGHRLLEAELSGADWLSHVHLLDG